MEAKDYPYKNLVCRGSWALGTACGHCERCEETRPAFEKTRPPPKSVFRIKPLVWEENNMAHPTWMFRAKTVFGYISVDVVDGDWWWGYDDLDYGSSFSWDIKYPTKQAAQAAAEAHYRERIKEGLEEV